MFALRIRFSLIFAAFTGVGVMCCGTSVMAAAVALDHRPSSGAKQTDARPSNDVAVLSDSDAVVSDSVEPVVPADLEIGQLDTDTVFEHVVVGADGVASVVDDGATAVAGERL
ncbi:MAG: hypothetical protein Q7R41_03610, partial [Phycisphaerales bacterium]|nr:hypothetical protein [Phycisphaerales bacterium]